MTDADADIRITFGGRIKHLLDLVFSEKGIQWALIAVLLGHILIGSEARHTAWRETLLSLVKDEHTVLSSHAKHSEEEAKRAEWSRKLFADYWLITCYNAATDAVQRKRCIERDVPTEDLDAYRRERRGR
jgi:hypothetical protein